MTHHFVWLDEVEHWWGWIPPVADGQRVSLVVEYEYHCSNCLMAYVSTQGIAYDLQEYQLHAGSNCSITSHSTCCCLVDDTAPVDYGWGSSSISHPVVFGLLQVIVMRQPAWMCYDIPLLCTITHTLLLHSPIIPHHSYQYRLLVITFDTHAYQFPFQTLFSNYLNNPSFLYIYQGKSLYIFNLFLPSNSNKWHLYLITSSIVCCKDFLGMTPSLDHTWAEPRT